VSVTTLVDAIINIEHTTAAASGATGIEHPSAPTSTLRACRLSKPVVALRTT
jgi:hypothetical protein